MKLSGDDAAVFVLLRFGLLVLSVVVGSVKVFQGQGLQRSNPAAIGNAAALQFGL